MTTLDWNNLELEDIQKLERAQYTTTGSLVVEIKRDEEKFVVLTTWKNSIEWDALLCDTFTDARAEVNRVVAYHRNN